MQRKAHAYVPGVAALLAALLAGCTGGSADGGAGSDDKPDGTGTSTAAARPGKYRTLPDACDSVGRGTLDEALPGIDDLSDSGQREKAYDGVATVTYDTDRNAGCRWRSDTSDAADRLRVDFERVVSYDTAVSDDTRAQEVFADRQEKAGLPVPAASDDEATRTRAPSASQSKSPKGSEGSKDGDGGDGDEGGKSADADASDEASDGAGDGNGESGDDGGVPSGPDETPAGLEPRTLDGLGNQAFVDDEAEGAASTARHRTVTVVFRTSNVLVTVVYERQPTAVGVPPDSKEMQDTARKVADELAERFGD